MNLRARGATMALGALCLQLRLPSRSRRRSPRRRWPSVADVTPGHSHLDVLAGRRATVAGSVRPAVVGRRVALQRRAGAGWNTIAHATTTGGGAFAFAFRPQKPGSAKLRVRVDSARREIGRLNVYRRAAVSWYGPGLYGN